MALTLLTSKNVKELASSMGANPLVASSTPGVKKDTAFDVVRHVDALGGGLMIMAGFIEGDRIAPQPLWAGGAAALGLGLYSGQKARQGQEKKARVAAALGLAALGVGAFAAFKMPKPRFYP